jgi:hypothetical protein
MRPAAGSEGGGAPASKLWRLSQSAAAWAFAFLFHESVAHVELSPYVPIYLNVEVCSIVESNLEAPVEAGTVE